MKHLKGHQLLAFGLLILVQNLSAGTRTWDGEGIDGLFSNVMNWDGNTTLPVSGTDVLQVGANAISAPPTIGFDVGEFRTPSFTFLPSAVSTYTVTAASLSDYLVLTGSGSTLVNSSPVRQKFELIQTAVGSANQTWDGGSAGLILAQVDLGKDQSLTVTGTGTTTSNRNEIAGAITGTGSSGLIKAGAGTLLLNNQGIASDYTGATTLLGGRLQLGAANQIPDGSKLVLGGGVFDTGGFSDTVGALSLSATTTIDFGTTDSVSLFFSDSHLELWSMGVVNIVNFTPGADFLRFGSNESALTASQLAQISFDGTAAMIDNSGFVQPVPEVGTGIGVLAALGLLASKRLPRRGMPTK